MQCPTCHCNYRSWQALLSHMNQPFENCYDHSQEVMDLAEELQRHSAHWQQPYVQQDQQSDKPNDQEFLMDVDPPFAEDIPSMEDIDPSADVPLVEKFKGAAKKYGRGKSLLTEFDNDRFSSKHVENIYYPFRSKAEWELALFLLCSDLSMTVIYLFLSLTHVHQFSLAVLHSC